MSDVDIVLGIAVQGVEKVYNLSNAMNQLNRAIVGATNPIKNLEARSRALSSAIGSSDSSLKNHAKTISEVARNNAILTNEFSRVRKEISGLGTSYRFASGASSEFRQIAVRDLKAYEQSLKSIRVRALVEDLKSLSQEQKRLGKDAQFVGRSLIIGLTTPIMGFSRFGLQSLVAIDREFVRLTKVLETVAPTADAAAKKLGVDLNNATIKQVDSVNNLVNNYNRLDEGLTKISRTYGVSKSLTVGLAGDFAELGIQVTKNIEEITELTAKTEKLGNMDIGNAKDLVQSLYFQAQRAFQQSGRLFPTVEARELAGIKAATAQLNLFNSVENVTALTLKDLGDAFPEVAAAATSFGLSMTEAAALLAPMKSAGFEVGASANSIKVSLQRLTAPTKQNAEMFKTLAKQYGTSFTEIKGTGLDAIQSLIDSFNELKDSAAGQEGAMEFFAKVFGVRQGPRMEVAIAQLAAFDKLLKNETIPATESAEKRLQGYANTAVLAANRTKNANLPVIQSFKDIGIIARVATAQAGQDVEGMQGKVTQSQINAAKEVRKKVTEEIVKAQREDQVDLIGSVATEAGRAMFIQLAGAANASEVAQRELEVSLGALDTQISILKNNFKAFASDILKSVKPAIEKIADISTTLIEKWSSLDDRTKKLISTMALIGAGATAAIGPLIFVFGQFRLAMGSIGKVLFGFLPSLKTMTIESLAARDGLLKLTKPLTVMGDTVVNTNGKFATFIATLSSGDGPVSNMAKKLGEMTGVLQKTTTAPLPLVSEVMSQKPVRGALSGDPTLDPMLSGGATPAARLRRLVRTSAGIIDPLDPTARIPSAARKAFAEEEFSMEQMGLRRSGASGTRYNIEQGFGLRGRRTGFRSISAADVGEAINLRQQAFERTGITRTSPSSSLGGGRIMRLGREISEERALSIAGGGIRGRALQAYDTIGARSSSALTSSLSAIKGAPTAAVGMYQKGLLGAKEAQRLLRIETLAFTGTGPGAFARMKASVGGFAKSFGLVNNAIKLTKVTLIASGIGVIILSLGVAIMLVMKNMDKFKQAGASGFATIKKVLGTLKTTFESLVRPIVDLFSSFGSGADGAEGAIGGLGSAFNGLTKVLEFVANMFKWLVENIIQPYLYGIVNLVKFVVNIFQGKWGDALKALAAAFANVFGGVVKLGITIMGFLVKQIINLIFEIPTAFMKAWAWGIEKATDLFFGFVEWVLGQVKRIPILGRFLGAAGGAVLGGLKNARDAYVGTVRTVANAVNSAGDTLKRGIDSGVEKAKGAVDKLAKGGIKKSKGKLDLFGGKDENSVDVDADDAQETIANQSGQGFEDGAEDGAKRIAAVLKGLKKELQQEIADRIKDTMQGVVESIQDVLKNQKESALAIYDEQIKKIEDVAKAEGRLTKEQEYQNRLREAEAERSLNRINSRRSYAMAVYAGNIDEARNIADQAARQETQDTEKINDINQDRAKEVAEQNRADLIDSIKLAKQEASKYFDDMIKSFTDAAKKITEFPPTTAEEFNTMLNQLIEGGNGFVGARAIANSMGTVFSDSFGGALSQLGVNASGPLTSSLEAIGKTLADNNPFGPTGVWNKTIDASIDALTRKYQGLTNTLTTIIDTKSESFKKLFEIYKKYQSLVDTGDPAGGAGTAGTSGATGPGLGGATGGRALTRQESIALGTGLYNAGMRADSSTPVTAAPTVADAVSLRTAILTAARRAYPQSNQSVLLSKTLGYFLPRKTNENISIRDLDIAFKNTNDNWNKSGTVANKARAVARMVLDKTKYLLNDSTYNLTPSSYFKGGMPYAMGGATEGPTQQGIPAILHGGEYVVRNSAVKKYGWGMMDKINKGTYKPKPYANGGMIDSFAKGGELRSTNNIAKPPTPLKDPLEVPGLNMGTDPNFNTTLAVIRKQYKYFYNTLRKNANSKYKPLYEWQVSMGGMNYNYMREIWRKEGKDWNNIGDYAGGGLGISYENWKKWGGLEFSDFPYNADPYQQMVVYNRMWSLGYKGKYGVKEKSGTAAARLKATYAGTLSDFHFGSPQSFRNDRYNNKNHPFGVGLIVSERDGIGFTRTGSAGIRKFIPISQLMTKSGEQYKDPREKAYTPFEYAIGGLVRGKNNKTSAGQFRMADAIDGWALQKIIDNANKEAKKSAPKKKSLWDRTLGKVVTGVANTAKIGTSSFISGVSFIPEYGVALGSTLAGYLPGTGRRQNNGNLFNQLVASPLMQTSLAQRLKAAKLTITTGQDYRELYGLDRGPFGLAGFLPTTPGEKAMEEASRSRNILGKGTVLSPGGALAYFGLDKTGLSKEGSKLYMATQLGGDFAAMAGLDPTMSLTKIIKGFGKGIKTVPKVFTKTGRGDIADFYWNKISNPLKAKFPPIRKISEELFYLKRGLLNKKQIAGSKRITSGSNEIIYKPARQAWYDLAEGRRSRAQADTRLVGAGINDPLTDVFGDISSVKDTYNLYSNSIFQEMFANRYARNTMGLKDKILYPTLPRIISRRLTKNVPMLDYIRGRLAFSKDYRNQAYAEDAVRLLRGEEPYSLVRSPLKQILPAIKERGLDALANIIPLKRNINNLVPYNSAMSTTTLQEYYQIAYSKYKYIQGLQKQLLRQRVLGNIEKSKLGRTGGFRTSNTVFDIVERLEKEFGGSTGDYFRKLSQADKVKAVKFPGLKDVSLQHEIDGMSHTVSLVRKGFPPNVNPYDIANQVPENALFNSSTFNFGMYPQADGSTHLNIGGLYGLKDFTSTDVPNLLAYVYANVIKPNNVTRITNGSYSKYSYALSRQLSDMMAELDPRIEVATPSIFDWRPNSIDFQPSIGRSYFPTEQQALENFNELNMLKDPIKSIKTKASVKEIVKARSRSKKKGQKIYSPDELEMAQVAGQYYIRQLNDLMGFIRGQLNPDFSPYGPFGIGMPSATLLNPALRRDYWNIANSRFMYPNVGSGNYAQDPIETLLELFRRMPNPELPSIISSSPWPQSVPGVAQRIPLDQMFNGGLIQSFEKGGLVKGNKTSAGQFRMADAIDGWEIQRITSKATEEVKKKKKSLWGKFTSAVTSPFRAVKNRLQKEMFGAMYGQGTGTSGSYTDNFKGFAEATKNASVFNPRGISDYEAPPGSIYANEALRQGMSMIRTGMDFTPSGGIMSAANAADKNRSNLSRLGWGLASYAAIAGNPTIFDKNAGYMGGAGKGIKGVSNLQKTIQEASNIEQFFPGTRIPMPAGLRPTLSQETGRILNLIGATASDSGDVLRRETLPYSFDSRHVQNIRSRAHAIHQRFYGIYTDPYRSYSTRDIANRMWYRTLGMPIVQPGSSAFREASLPVSDFWRIARSSGRFSDEQIKNAFSLAQIPSRIDDSFPSMYGYSDFDRFMDALYTGRVVNRKLPTDMVKYTSYISQRQIQAQMRERVLKNIHISRSIRMARMKGVLSSREEYKALMDKMILNVEKGGARGNRYEIKTWQPLSDGSYGNTSDFSFYIDPEYKTLSVGVLQRGNSFGSAIDVMKMLSYVYSDIMVPNNIDTIYPGSTSVHSEALVIKLKEIFQKLDPNVRFLELFGGEHNPTNLNDIDFNLGPYLNRYTSMMGDTLGEGNVFRDANVRTRTHLMLRRIMENARGVTGESKSSITNRIGGYANGGFVNAFASQGVPAMLHGGEYVVNSNAVKNLGIAALQAINDMRFNTPKSPSYAGPVQPQTSSTSTVHIYVDNFIGEKQWFESMMKDYNINVAPQNQKAAGLNNTTISTYRGINRGL